MQNNSTPLISVVMPHYNGGGYASKAVQSILNQSYKNFELIIIDDCSIDGSYEILQNIQDPRIILLQQNMNGGGGRALNRAINIAKGKYIACMDADDIARENRLQHQVAFLEKHPSYGMVGCHYDKIDQNDLKIKSVSIPIIDTEIRYRMIFNYPFCHPTVMYRASVLKKHVINYNPTSRFAEDYEVAIQVSQYAKLYNLPDNLFCFRKHENSITEKNNYKNNMAKAEFIQKVHPNLLHETFLNSENYKNLIDIFFLEDFSIIYKDPEVFFKMMFLCADSFIIRTEVDKKNIIYRETLNLILRYYVIKTKGYKNIKGLISLFKNRLFLKYSPSFIYHQIRRLCYL